MPRPPTASWTASRTAPSPAPAPCPARSPARRRETHMVQVMSSPSADLRATPRRRAGDDQATFLSRWLKVWVILLTVVVLVVAGYLIIITNTLASINCNLATADRAVPGAGGNTQTLPAHVDRITGALAAI